MRLIAIDLGSKKCGIAISDPLQIIAQPLKTIFYEKQNFSFLVIELKKIIENYHPIEKIIIGFPKNINNSLSNTGKMVLKFKNILEKEQLNIEIILIDEKYTSKYSDKIMQQIGLSNKKKKQTRDKIAAQKILENYLFYYKK